MDLKLAGKVAIVTGGSLGIGRAIAEELAAEHAHVVIVARDAARVEAVAHEISARGAGRVMACAGDMTQPAAIDAMVAAAIGNFGQVDILVNNAAGNFLAQSHRLSARAVDAVLGIVLHGSAYCTLGCGRRWIDGGRGGTVLSVLTLSALSGAAFTVPSAMAKAGVLAMTRSLAVEWGPRGIRCNAVAPGSFPTAGASAGLAPAALPRPPPERTIPMARPGEHRELADVCAFLASDLSSYVNGECIAVDGGKQWLSGSAQNDTATLLGWDDAHWAALKPSR